MAIGEPHPPLDISVFLNIVQTKWVAWNNLYMLSSLYASSKGDETLWYKYLQKLLHCFYN